ncbi:MAG: hypothetical protein ACRDBO_02655 [Lachnospiraceae bacterium]
MIRLLRYPILIFIYGTFYTLCEILWKGGFDQLHGSMFILAAMGGIIVGLLNDRYSYDMDLLYQCLIGGFLVTLGEGLVGHIFNSDYSIWDYRTLPLSFWDNQVNLFFTLIWSFVMCPIAILIDDIYDYYILKSNERPYYKLCGRVLFIFPERKKYWLDHR